MHKKSSGLASKGRQNPSGFTIVELLIVIVVIAILATISIVAYSGMQQRAKNTAIISAASSSLRLMQAYIAANGTYPIFSGNACVTTDTGCISDQGTTVGDSSTFDTAMATVGTLPQSVPVAGAERRGVYFIYSSGIMVGGQSRPMLLAYYLSGTSQKCGLDNIVQYTWPNLPLSSIGYSANMGTTTMCWVSVPGPGV